MGSTKRPLHSNEPPGKNLTKPTRVALAGLARLNELLPLEEDDTTCLAYRTAVMLTGEEHKDEIVDIATSYAADTGHDITAWSTDVIVAYLDGQCA